MPHRRGPLKGRSSRGFALAAVVVCLVLVSVALVGLARNSLRMAAESERMRQAFAARWAAQSCRSALLSVAPDLFDRWEEEAALEKEPRPAPSSAVFRFRLGAVDLQVDLRDASAAFDINTAYHWVGRPRLEATLRRLVGASAVPLLRLHPAVRSQGRPDPREEGAEAPAAFQAWGQVFSMERLAPQQRADLPRWTAQLTCLPDAGLNVRRAPDAVLEATCRLVVSSSEARKIRQACRKRPRPHVHRILEQLGIDHRDQVLLRTLLTEQSTCYAVWVEARTANDRRLLSATIRYHEDGARGATLSCY